MTTALATRDDVSVDGEVIEMPQPAAPLTLFGTTDPTAVVERASTVASALAKVIGERELTTRIGNKDHVQVEGWTLLGSMLGVFAEVEWTRQLVNGWEARAVARTLAGNVVGAAEAMCTVDEARWKRADDYAVRSMAQTRAVSKALRMPLGFIMHLAGYSPTPAEEVPEEQPEPGNRGGTRARQAQAGSAPSAPAPRSAEEQALLDRILEEPGMTHARMSLMADEVGVPKGERANADQLREMIARFIEQSPEPAPAAGEDAPASAGGAGARTAPPDSDAAPEADLSSDAATDPAGGSPLPAGSGNPTMADVLAVTGGEEVPPKPGTDEYKALKPHEKAAARAYHSKPVEPVQETLNEALGTPLAE